MRSDEIDLAFYCGHMAAHLVEQDDRLMIYGPVIMNAEALATKGKPDQVTRLGIGQKRGHLQTLIRETYPTIAEIEEMSPRVLPYSLADGQIDGAVVDVTKTALLPEFEFFPVANHDYISYVLVARKDLIGSAPFSRFLEAYRRAVDGLQDSPFDDVLSQGSSIRFLYLD